MFLLLRSSKKLPGFCRICLFRRDNPVYLHNSAYLKKLLLILLSFSVMAFSTQTVCIAMPAEEESSCEASHCCKDETGAEKKESTPGKIKNNGNCCIYNVLSVEQVPQFTYRQLHVSIFKTGFLEKFHTDQLAADFWQPPRAC